MWHYSMQGLPFVHIAMHNCELLPHIFTFVPHMRDSYFLWHYLAPVLTGGPDVIGMRCSVLSGLSFPT